MNALRRFAIIWIALLAIIIGSSLLIVTDAKRVHRVLQRCEKAVRAADADALFAQIAPEYSFAGFDRAAFLELTRRIFNRNRFATTFVSGEKIKVKDDAATITFNAFFQGDAGSAIREPVRSRWRMRLERRDNNQWLITEIELISVDNHPMGDLRQAMELAASFAKDTDAGR